MNSLGGSPQKAEAQKQEAVTVKMIGAENIRKVTKLHSGKPYQQQGSTNHRNSGFLKEVLAGFPGLLAPVFSLENGGKNASISLAQRSFENQRTKWFQTMDEITEFQYSEKKKKESQRLTASQTNLQEPLLDYSPSRSATKIINNASEEGQRGTQCFEYKHISNEKLETCQQYDVYLPDDENNLVFIDQGISGRHLQYISKEKLIEITTHMDHFDPDSLETLLYTYSWYFMEKELFLHLVNRFRVEMPRNMSPSEAEMFRQKKLSQVQIKVLIVLKTFVKTYRKILIILDEMEEILVETMCQLAVSSQRGSLITVPFQQLLRDLEKINTDRKLIDRDVLLLQQRFLLMDNAKYWAEEPFFEKFKPIIRAFMDRDPKLLQAICLFDFENFSKIHLFEFLSTNWTKPRARELAPNITYIWEVFNRLNKFFRMLLLLSNQQKKGLQTTYSTMIWFINELINVSDLNGAYAIYDAAKKPQSYRFVEAGLIKLSKDDAKKMRKFDEIFDITDRQANLKKIHYEAKLPCIPFLGAYLNELTYIEEQATFNSKGLINYGKFTNIASIIKKLETYRSVPYNYPRSSPVFESLLQELPNIDEDTLFDYGEKILPIS
jgi:RasGEF domain/RasGEF N-terminal motif